VQDIFLIAFNSQLTDIVRRGVVCQLAVFIETLNVFVVDLGDVADHVRQRGTVRVVATLVAFHFHTGKTVLVDGKAGDLDFRQVGFNRNGGKTVRTGALFLEGSNIVIVKIDNASQCFQRILHVVDFFRHHLNLVDGAV